MTDTATPPVVEAKAIYLYEGSSPPRLLYETVDGLRYTPEQWQLVQMAARLEVKIDALVPAIEAALASAKSEG